MQVIEQYSYYNHYNNNNPRYIIVHYVGANSSAKNNADYFCGGDRGSSAHEFVDDNYCYKVIKEHQGAWHIGNSITDPNNTNSIGIEMCLVNGVVTNKTEDNTIERVKYYMSKYNIPIQNVRTHAEVTGYGKICPNWSDNNWARWNNFKNKIVNNVKNNEEVIQMFSWRWYLDRYEDVRKWVNAQNPRNDEEREQLAYKHYKDNWKPDNRRGIPDISNFNEKAYLELNNDVKKAVDRKDFCTGLEHYILWGYKDRDRKINYDNTENNSNSELDSLKRKVIDLEKKLKDVNVISKI